jgi:hypothetical protein
MHAVLVGLAIACRRIIHGINAQDGRQAMTGRRRYLLTALALFAGAAFGL